MTDLQSNYINVNDSSCRMVATSSPGLVIDAGRCGLRLSELASCPIVVLSSCLPLFYIRQQNSAACMHAG
jgi:hypothetical protein